MKLKSLALTIVIAISLASCANNQKKTSVVPDGVSADKAQVDNGNNNGIALELNGDSDSNKAGSLQTVYFDFNSAALSDATKASLENNAKFLKANTTVKVQVEGHCDERGGVQFNLALGERRAKGVREYLVSQGIDGSRVSTISFGKERPVAFGHDEEGWSKNRRANFVITAK
jgi:peptidoglycan-associated lipoprotein